MKILIALDGSAHSQAALDAVFSRHWRKGSEVRLMKVLPRGLPLLGAPPEQQAEAASAGLTALAAELHARYSHISFTVEVAEGDVDDAIIDAAERWEAEMIAVGCRGQSMLETLFLGSVSQSVLQKAGRPVLVSRFTRDEGRGNIIIAVDSSPFAAAAIEWLINQYWARYCNIGLLSILEPPRQNLMADGSLSQASRSLLSWENVKYLSESRLQMWATVIQQYLPDGKVFYGLLDGDPKQALVDAAANWPAELVVMGSHGRRGIGKLVLGSVSQHVAARAQCSVEIVRGVIPRHYEQIEQEIGKQNTLSNVLARRVQRPPTSMGGGGAMFMGR